MTRCSACANEGVPCKSCMRAMQDDIPMTLNTNPTRERLTENQRKRENNNTSVARERTGTAEEIIQGAIDAKENNK